MTAWAAFRNLRRGLLRPMMADRAMFRERPFQGVLFYIWLYPFTPAGKVVMLALATSTAAGSITDEMPSYQIPVTLFMLMMTASAVGSVLRWMSVSISGQWPERVTAELPAQGEFTVTNDSRWPLFDASVACFQLPRSWEIVREDRIVTTLAPGDTVKMPIRVIPHQRGLYQLPAVRAFSTFPFNLFRNQLGRKESRSVLVLPQFQPLNQIRLDVGHRYQPGGAAYTSQIGESPEYIGNRDYLPGDSLRHVDFRSWARLARPVVREYQEEYFHRMGVVLDTFVPRFRRAGRSGYPELEAAVSLTAAVADVFSRGEYLLDVFAAGPDLHVFRTGRHTTPIDAVLEILACVPSCRERPFERLVAALANEFPHISAVVCIFLDWDDARERLVHAALEAGCHVKVVVIQRSPPKMLLDQPSVEFIHLTPAQVKAGIGTL